MTYSVDVVLELALLVNIGGAGLSYFGTAIRVMDRVIVKVANEKLRRKQRGIGISKTQDGTPQGAGNLPAMIKKAMYVVSGLFGD